MKSLLVSLLFVASAPALASALPSEITRLMDKDGTFVSLTNGKVVEHEHGTACRIIPHPYGADDAVWIDSVSYFNPVAYLEGAKRSVLANGTIVYATTSSGRRPGGSVCGDFTPLRSYKQTVEVTKDTVLLRQRIGCGLSRTLEIVEGCKVKN